MGKFKELHSQHRKTHGCGNKPHTSSMKSQSSKPSSPTRLPIAPRSQHDSLSSANKVSSDDGLNDEKIAEKKLLNQKARKARNQRRYYQKWVQLPASFASGNLAAASHRDNEQEKGRKRAAR